MQLEFVGEFRHFRSCLAGIQHKRDAVSPQLLQDWFRSRPIVVRFIQQTAIKVCEDHELS